MEKAFERAPYPDVFAREQLAVRIGLNESRVQVKASDWFKQITCCVTASDWSKQFSAIHRLYV